MLYILLRQLSSFIDIGGVSNMTEVLWNYVDWETTKSYDQNSTMLSLFVARTNHHVKSDFDCKPPNNCDHVRKMIHYSFWIVVDFLLPLKWRETKQYDQASSTFYKSVPK